jgi:ATP-dependent RNA helicase DDX27
LDEADRLLDLGFRQEVEELVRMCPTERQTMLFSATITEEVAQLANLSLKAPLQVDG